MSSTEPRYNLRNPIQPREPRPPDPLSSYNDQHHQDEQSSDDEITPRGSPRSLSSQSSSVPPLTPSVNLPLNPATQLPTMGNLFPGAEAQLPASDTLLHHPEHNFAGSGNFHRQPPPHLRLQQERERLRREQDAIVARIRELEVLEVLERESVREGTTSNQMMNESGGERIRQERETSQTRSETYSSTISRQLRDSISNLPKPDKFSGEEDIDKLKEHIRQVRMFLRAAGPMYPEEELKVNYASMLLRGNASQWYDNLVDIGKTPATLGEYFQQIRQAFGPYNRELDAHQKIKKTIQTDNVVKYSIEFRAVVARSGYDEHNKCLAFLDGLKPYCHGGEVLKLRPPPSLKDLTELIQAAVEVDQANEQSLQVSARYSSTTETYRASNNRPVVTNTRQSTTTTQYRPNISNLAKNKSQSSGLSLQGTRNYRQSTNNKTIRVTDAEFDKLMKEGRCFKCKKVGHLSSECPDNGYLQPTRQLRTLDVIDSNYMEETEDQENGGLMEEGEEGELEQNMEGEDDGGGLELRSMYVESKENKGNNKNKENKENNKNKIGFATKENKENKKSKENNKECTKVGKFANVLSNIVELVVGKKGKGTRDTLVFDPRRSKLFTLPVCVVERTELNPRALLDTGATANFVDDAFVVEAGLEKRRLPRPQRLVLADGEPSKIGEITHEVRMTLLIGHGFEPYSSTFYVTPVRIASVVLGMTFFSAVQPIFDWDKRMLYPANNLQWLQTRVLEDKTEPTVKSVVPAVYHKYLDVFAKKAADTLCHTRRFFFSTDRRSTNLG
ncbi:hypothetical protein M231_06209 [Tremella mesenterica]|uniref:CCHC-type domain-containing protein n=1 Tax=Tremella mesenterica TaxID=5217 RepID=A0A4Q1BCC2_TREME|nr:hypothetical protein M231_06209 [Tremella mesenterica]